MRLRLGQLEIDPLTFGEAIDAVEKLVTSGQGGAVFTPNIDHVVSAEESPAFREAYRAASLSLVDGKPLVWASRLLGAPLPEKVSGADLILPLLERASLRKWRVYFLGARPGVPERAARAALARFPFELVGTDSPEISLEAGHVPTAEALLRVQKARPDLLFVALGSPKQELWIARHREALGPTVALGIGAGLDFLAKEVKRAPAWMSHSGLEWLFRLGQEPKRLWRRYLVRDPRFLLILLSELRRKGPLARKAPP